MELLIRSETAADAAALYDVHVRAFGRAAEAELAARLRVSP